MINITDSMSSQNYFNVCTVLFLRRKSYLSISFFRFRYRSRYNYHLSFERYWSDKYMQIRTGASKPRDDCRQLSQFRSVQFSSIKSDLCRYSLVPIICVNEKSFSLVSKWPLTNWIFATRTGYHTNIMVHAPSRNKRNTFCGL